MNATAIALVFSLMLQTSAAKTSGSVCVSSVPVPAPGEVSLGNPAGGGRTFNYAVRVDEGQLTDVPHDKGLRIDGLALGTRHLVRIYRDGKRVESFYFTFEEMKSEALCLWYKSLYETWSLSTRKQMKSICNCRE
jgi:hypothetical protein